MTTVQLLSEQRLKTDGFINDNVDTVYIFPAVKKAQDISLTQLIGSALVDRLCQLVMDGFTEETMDYKNLLDIYIIPYLEWVVKSEIILPTHYKIRNAGVVSNTDFEHFSSADKEMILQLIDDAKNTASWYANRLTDFLCHNSIKYPEYSQCGCCGGVGANPKSGLDSIIWLPK